MVKLLAALAALLLAVRPDDPEVHRVVLAPGDTVVATSEGSGTSIVFVPGLLGNSFGFRRVAPVLADSGYRTVIIEPLGTGNSSRPRAADYSLEAQSARVSATMEQLGVDEAFLVCHSTGTSICLRLALQQPGKVRGIISINGGPDERAGTPGLKTAIRLAPLIRLLGAGRIIRGRVRNGLKEASADPSWVTDDVVAAYTAPFRDFSASLRALRAMSEAPETDSLASRLPQIAAPVLLLVGPAGRAVVTPPATIQLLADRLPEFAIDTVPNAGHYLHEEQPDSVIAALQRFVRGSAVPARPAGW